MRAMFADVYRPFCVITLFAVRAKITDSDKFFPVECICFSFLSFLFVDRPKPLDPGVCVGCVIDVIWNGLIGPCAVNQGMDLHDYLSISNQSHMVFH